MPDHPEHAHLGLEQGDLLKITNFDTLLDEQGLDLLAEDGSPLYDETGTHDVYLTLEQNEGSGFSRFWLDGEAPFSFILLEDASGDLLLEEQTRINATGRGV